VSITTSSVQFMMGRSPGQLAPVLVDSYDATPDEISSPREPWARRPSTTTAIMRSRALASLASRSRAVQPTIRALMSDRPGQLVSLHVQRRLTEYELSV
jgi:hypothetical protein